MAYDTDSTTIAWIGTGVMGAPMAGHLLDEGYGMIVHNRTPHRAQWLLEHGAGWANTPGEAAARADVVCTMVGYPEDVREVYCGPGGILEKAKKGTLLIDFTTSDPQLAIEIASLAAERGMMAMDAPVSGGQIGAKEARLSIMAGASEDAFNAALPLLQVFGKTIVRQGGPGMGQQAKLCNQIAIAGQMLGVTEALVYAKSVGLDPQTALQSLSAGAAAGWTLENVWPKMVNEDFAPGFYVHHFIKDMDLALNESERLQLFTPALGLARLVYDRVVELGGEQLGTQALYLALKDRVPAPSE